MADGRVEAITVVTDDGVTVEAVDAVEASADGGVAGDYHRDITLIAAEVLERLWQETGIHLGPRDSRRNILTRGVDLNALVGRRFRVGGVEAVGVEIAEPCTKLQRLTGEPGVLRGLAHRGGLRADVVEGGRIVVGDAVGAGDSGPDPGR